MTTFATHYVLYAVRTSLIHHSRNLTFRSNTSLGGRN